MISKICDSCGKRKDLSRFSPNKKSKGGYRNRCKMCVAQAASEHREKNRIKIRKQQSEFRQRHKSRLQKKYRSWKENRTESGANARYSREYQKRNRLACNLRKHLRTALKGGRKSGSAVRDLGCSIEELRIYLSSKLQLGMSWENYGEWQIDHIIPLSNIETILFPLKRQKMLQICSIQKPNIGEIT